MNVTLTSEPKSPKQSAIAVKGLRKTYVSAKGGVTTEALKGIDLEIPRGSFFGLLGPNGAGKSTFINILAGLVIKSSGTATIWGFDIDKNPRNTRVAIGVVPQEIYFDTFFTPREVLEFQAGMYGVRKEMRRTAEILEALSLTDKADVDARSLSGGMKRRLLVAKAMVHNPPILVLDEPTAGVDVELRRQLWNYVRALNTQGITIVLTTHYLEEAEELCDRIAIINHGEVAACDTTKNLLERIEEKEITLVVDREISKVPATLAAFRTEIAGPRHIKIFFDRTHASFEQILSAVHDAGYGIIDVSTVEGNLEDIFLQLTRHHPKAHASAG